MLRMRGYCWRLLSRCVCSQKPFGQRVRYVQLVVHPEVDLIDKPVKIKVSKLSPKQKFTLHATMVEGEKRYSSFGYFIANSSGELDVSEAPSEGGTYTGIDGVGLLWSLKLEPNQRPGTRLLKKDVTTPFYLNINTYDGWQDWDVLCSNYESQSLKSLAECQIQRWYLKPSAVDRIPVRAGNIRGRLFLPKGDGKFPCVIDMFGSGGGLPEHRAALLASRGKFAVLALAFFLFEDLPKTWNNVALEYFEEAIDWMLAQNFCKDTGVGLVAVSGGADLALNMAVHYKEKVKAAVLINPNCRFLGFPVTIKDQRFPRFMHESFVDFHYTRFGLENRMEYLDAPEDELFRIEESTSPFLLIASGDDRLVDTVNHFQLVERLKKYRDPPNYEAFIYPGAGHLLEPPYAPLNSSVFHAALDALLLYGGVAHLHNKAQVDCWQRVLTFLKKHLEQSSKCNSQNNIPVTS